MQKSILIFDDDEGILTVCKLILKRKGYKVSTRTRCEHIIKDVEETQPDLILMDLWIPEIGGEQAITILKEQPKYRDTPVILFSANTNIKEVCQNINANGYLKKPFDITNLENIIRENLNDAKHP